MTDSPSAALTTPSTRLSRWATARPHEAWIVAGTQTVTYNDANAMAGRFVTYLKSLDMQVGHVVALDVPPALHAVLTVALFRFGAISCQYPRLVVGDAFRCDWLISTPVSESSVADRTLLLASHNMSLIDGLEPTVTDGPLESTATFRLIFSSGTTGRPKPVAASTDLLDQRGHHSVATRPAGDSYFCAMDVSTTAGLRTLLWTLHEGTSYLVPGDGKMNLALMKRHRVDVATMSPDQMRALLDAAREADEHLPDLKFVVYAGSFLDPSLAQRFRTWFDVPLYTSLGSTEAGIITVRSYDTDDHSDMGYVVDDVELEIVGDDDVPLPPMNVGHIRYRRPRDPREYFRDPVATEKVFRLGWCYPGDLGELSSDGQLFLRGRRDDVVNVGGVKIDPSLYDSVARDVIGVADAAGFTFNDPTGESVLAVAVVTTFGFRDQELVDAMVQAFGSRRPTVITKVDAIPRTSMGKPIRTELAHVVGDAFAKGAVD